jgi:hypothetical protein
MLFELMGMGRHTHAARADMSRITVVLSCLLLASCVAVPAFDETLGGTHWQAEIEITGELLDVRPVARENARVFGLMP